MGAYAHSAPIGGGEFLWALGSTALALVVVVVTARVVKGWTILPAPEAGEPESGLRKILYRKYYVDELYDRIVVQPVLRGSRFAWRVIDDTIIDGAVNAAGYLGRAVGWVGSLFQTGQVNTYAFVFTLGVLLILGVSIF